MKCESCFTPNCCGLHGTCMSPLRSLAIPESGILDTAKIAAEAAREICQTFDVACRNGVSYPNSREQTIAIIIEQRMKRAGK